MSSACAWRKPGFRQNDRHPVVFVSYEDAVAYADWLSKADHAHYRLPTEAEWEYACRAGAETEFWWGNDPATATEYANLGRETDKFVNTSPVKLFKPNPWGLYDMLGNVWEWCSDWVDDEYYKNSPAKNPKGPLKGAGRAYRGGSWCDPNPFPAFRNRQAPTCFYNNSGFRLVRDLPLTPEQLAQDAKERWERTIGKPLAIVGRVGQDVRLGDVRWKVVAARDLGSTLKPRHELAKPKTTPGKFIYVELEIEAVGKQPESFSARELYDGRGRQFSSMSGADGYFDNTVFLLQNINPNVPVRQVEIFEVPKDASDFAVVVSSLRLLDRQEGVIALGL